MGVAKVKNLFPLDLSLITCQECLVFDTNCPYIIYIVNVQICQIVLHIRNKVLNSHLSILPKQPPNTHRKVQQDTETLSLQLVFFHMSASLQSVESIFTSLLALMPCTQV